MLKVLSRTGNETPTPSAGKLSHPDHPTILQQVFKMEKSSICGMRPISQLWIPLSGITNGDLHMIWWRCPLKLKQISAPRSVNGNDGMETYTETSKISVVDEVESEKYEEKKYFSNNWLSISKTNQICIKKQLGELKITVIRMWRRGIYEIHIGLYTFYPHTWKVLQGTRYSSVVEHSLMVWWVIRSIPFNYF